MAELAIIVGWMLGLAFDPFALVGFVIAARRAGSLRAALAYAVLWSLAEHMSLFDLLFRSHSYPIPLYLTILLAGSVDAAVITLALYGAIAYLRARRRARALAGPERPGARDAPQTPEAPSAAGDAVAPDGPAGSPLGHPPS